MKLGVVVSPAAGWSYRELSDLAQGAEKSGFASFGIQPGEAFFRHEYFAAHLEERWGIAF